MQLARNQWANLPCCVRVRQPVSCWLSCADCAVLWLAKMVSPQVGVSHWGVADLARVMSHEAEAQDVVLATAAKVSLH